MRILIADDDPKIRKLLRRTFVDAGYDVLEAEHGYEALKVLKQTPCDLLWTDFNMPNMTGYELAIWARVWNPNLPIVLYSGSIPEYIERRVFSVVVDKPAPFKNILATVEELLGIHAD